MKDKLNDEFHKLLINFVENTTHEYFTTHTKICYFIVERIYRRVKNGHGSKFGGIKIDDENRLIIDGNHRYIAYKLAGFQYEKISWRKNYSDPHYDINDIKIEIEEDWDMNCEKNRKYCDDNFLKDL
ncbi:hypothetical protein HZP65_06490 [Elizabethkingia anophelis]|nr:hypothetical protein [Elizabethkingia anophelis]MCT4275312.1 hypothetical protein [Elizabethkingia anophelis]MCT4279404.1 hypothetical protein [Elizabethkingia anophelis]